MDSWPLEEKMGVAQLAKSYQATGTGLHWLFSIGLKERPPPPICRTQNVPKNGHVKINQQLKVLWAVSGRNDFLTSLLCRHLPVTCLSTTAFKQWMVDLGEKVVPTSNLTWQTSWICFSFWITRSWFHFLKEHHIFCSKLVPNASPVSFFLAWHCPSLSEIRMFQSTTQEDKKLLVM